MDRSNQNIMQVLEVDLLTKRFGCKTADVEFEDLIKRGRSLQQPK
jgi:hypothetical protein